MQQLIHSVNHRVTAALSEVITLGRTLKKLAAGWEATRAHQRETTFTPVEPTDVVDQHSLVFGENGVVRGVEEQGSQVDSVLLASNIDTRERRDKTA